MSGTLGGPQQQKSVAATMDSAVHYLCPLAFSNMGGGSQGYGYGDEEEDRHRQYRSKYDDDFESRGSER